MQTTKKLSLIVFILIVTSHLIAQSDKSSKAFIDGIDRIVLRLENESLITKLKKGKLSLKTTTVGNFDNSAKHFKRKIKFKNGLKIEKIKIKKRSMSGHKKYLDIILVNDEYYYIKRINNSKDQNQPVGSVDILVKGKVYTKTDKLLFWHKNSK